MKEGRSLLENQEGMSLAEEIEHMDKDQVSQRFRKKTVYNAISSLGNPYWLIMPVKGVGSFCFENVKLCDRKHRDY